MYFALAMKGLVITKMRVGELLEAKTMVDLEEKWAKYEKQDGLRKNTAVFLKS